MIRAFSIYNNFILVFDLPGPFFSICCFASKIDKTKFLKSNGSFMKVKSIAECSFGAFCNTLDLH